MIQRYNAVLLHDGLTDDSTDWCTTSLLTFAFFKLPQDYIYTEG